MMGTIMVVLYSGLIVGVVLNLVLISIMKKMGRKISKVMDEHKKRVAEYGGLCDDEFDKMKAMSALCLHLIPLKIQMDVQGVSLEGRHARLDKKKWSSQFEYGVNRACGFDIDWIIDEGTENVTD